ncbi:hypothetical protein [Zooshikella ganghwensis]|nr:hypothetical protein [Zooshikella ganghwensis]
MAWIFQLMMNKKSDLAAFNTEKHEQLKENAAGLFIFHHKAR